MNFNVKTDLNPNKPGVQIEGEKGEKIEKSAPTASSSDSVIFSCYPLERFNVGTRWQFENGQLKLNASEAKEFEEFLASADVRTKNLVKKIDVDAANAMLLARAPVASKVVDSAIHGEDRTPIKGTENLNQTLQSQQAGQ